MKIEDEIRINKYGQDILEIESLVNQFYNFDLTKKRVFLKHIVYNFVLQSKVVDADVFEAIVSSNLKPTYTPCVMLIKGVATHNLELIIKLPESELDKVLILLLSLYKIGYKRRYRLENDNPNKWWYWDLSDEKRVEQIRMAYKSDF